MDWDSYKNVYKNFEHSVSQSFIIALVLQETLKGWPQSLPEEIKAPIADGLKAIGELFSAFFEQKISSEQFHGETDRIMVEWDKVEGRRALLGTALIMHWSRPDPSKKEVDFTRLIHSQGVVMLFAHLDGFLADSVRTICKVKPEVLKCDKKIDWEEIVSSGTWDNLIENLIEKYVFGFGWQSVTKRVEFMEKHLGLTLKMAKEDLQQVDEAERIRNVIIHNGGNASQEYLDRSGRTDLAIGQPVPIDLAVLKNVFKSTRSLAESIAKEIGTKFFKIDRPYLT